MKRTTQLRIHLTSFGPFLDVVDNPSHTIGNLVERHLRETQRDEAPLVVLAEHVNLEVSIDAVAEYFSTFAEQSQGDDQGRCVIDLFVHLGVHRGAKGEVRVETCAFNDIHCPQGDFKGVRLDHQPIFVTCPKGVKCLPKEEVEFSVDAASCEGDRSAVATVTRDVVLLRTNVPRSALSKAVESVREQCSREHPTGVLEDGRFAANVIFSEDAGRYLCNYCYCRSLAWCAERNAADAGSDRLDTPHNNGKWMSLFLHVLDPDRNDFGCKNPTCDAQATCILNLLHQLAERLS